MRIGLMARAEPGEFDRLQRLGFRAMEWVRFDTGPCGVAHAEWKPHAESVAAAATERGIRISAIAALYANPLLPDQRDYARATFQRAVEVAAHIGVETVAGFAGGIIRTNVHPRGGNPVPESFEASIPEMLAFWEPLAAFAADHGIRLAFENCPQGPLPLPVMGYNALSRPAIWERFFEATRHTNLGLEWDPSHLVCQLIDPVENLRRFAARVFHVHAKDGWINRPLLAREGICHPGVAEHRLPGTGDVNWPEIIRILIQSGYDSDLTVEGRHDPVYRDHPDTTHGPLSGQTLEDPGLSMARKRLELLIAS